MRFIVPCLRPSGPTWLSHQPMNTRCGSSFLLDTMAYRPIFRLGLFQMERSGREDKLGGLPFGFPADRWPSCSVCKSPQNYIAQFRHSEMINLGQEGRTLFLFQCSGAQCETWDYRSGANAAILIESSDLTESSTPSPFGTEIEPEGIIIGWQSVDAEPWISCVAPVPSFPANHSAYRENHFAGLIPAPRFLVQLVGRLDFAGPAPTPSATGAEHLHYWGGEYGQDNMRQEASPYPRKHFGLWSRGQSDYPGRPSQVATFESGDWCVEWANFGGGTA